MIEGLECVDLCAVIAISQQHSSDVVKLSAFVMSSERGQRSSLLVDVRNVLPNYCLPDHIEFVNELPINEHGTLFYFKSCHVSMILPAFILQERLTL